MTVDEIELIIANTMINSITEDWKKAILKIKIQKGYTGSSLRYFDDNNTEKGPRLEKSNNFSDIIHELHAITTEGGHNRWNKLEFTLFPDGKFDLQFIWDQEWQDEVDGYNKKS